MRICTWYELHLSELHHTVYGKDKFKEQENNVHKFAFLQTRRVHNIHTMFLTG